LVSCNKENYNQGADSHKIPNIIWDSDLGSCTDDMMAMQALFAAREWKQCNIIAIMQSRKNQKAKSLLDRFMHYYKADDIPIGFVEGEEDYFDITPYYQLVDSLDSKGAPLYEPTGIPLSDRLPAWKLYRKMLAEAEDNSVSIICTGMFTNLGLLISSGPDDYSSLTGMELINKKVCSLDVVGGNFIPIPLRYTTPGDPCRYLSVEYNVGGDVPLAKKVIEEWSKSLNVLPVEEGLHFPSYHDDILSLYASQPLSPIYQVYSRWDEWEKGDVGQYWWDVLAVIHCFSPEIFNDSDKGFISIDNDGKTAFEFNPSGNAKIISMAIQSEFKLWEFMDKISTYSPE